MAAIRSFRISTFAFPRDRRIGDCQVAIDTNWVGALELTAEDGTTGLGFFLSLFAPLPAAGAIRAYIERALWPALEGVPAEGLIHRVTRPRGGNVRTILYDLETALDQALWDLAAKRAGLPLFRYLGGREGRPEAYASGLEFHLADEVVRAFYESARADGYRAFKVKVGYRDVHADIGRLNLVRETVGADARLMIDANEAWNVAETRDRVTAYAAAGIRLYWVEDPILRSDLAGLAALRGGLAGARVNAGEYLGIDGRLALIEAGAADVVQLGRIGEGLRVAAAAAAKGIPVALGNTLMNIGAHLAAALPEVDMVEDSRLNTTDILAVPFPIEDGRFVLPEIPGHGLALADDAVARCGGEAA